MWLCVLIYVNVLEFLIVLEVSFYYKLVNKDVCKKYLKKFYIIGYFWNEKGLGRNY